MTLSFKREIRMIPGFRDKGDGYGMHGMEIHFIVSAYLPKPMKEPGDSWLFAVHLNIMTDWIPADNLVRYNWLAMENRIGPIGAAVAYHSPIAFREHHETIGPKAMTCQFIGAPCYCDVSGVMADVMLCTLTLKGHEAVFCTLEEYFRDTFSGFIEASNLIHAVSTKAASEASAEETESRSAADAGE